MLIYVQLTVVLHSNTASISKVIQLNNCLLLFSATEFTYGTCFSVEAGYSAKDTYSKPDNNGEKRMYLCRVLTGDYTLGKKEMASPPSKSSNPNVIYDSVVDNKDNPQMFIVFQDGHAYPEYLITFK